MKIASGLSVMALWAAMSAAPAVAESINVLVEGGGAQEQKPIAEKFKAETGIDVNFVEVPYAGVYDKLSAEIASGKSQYDVATVDVIWLPKFAEFAEPLDALFTEDIKKDLPAALLSDAQIGGKFVGMPTWANSEILFYRKDLFSDPKQQAAFKAKYGRDLAPPKTWQEFRDAAAFFTQDNNGTKLYGTDVVGANPEEWMATVLQAGSPGVVLDDKGNVIIDNAQHLKALQFYTDVACKDHSTPAGAAQVDWGAAQNMFYQGQTAMMRFWAHAYRLTPKDSKVADNVGVAPMIGGDAGVAGIPGPWYNIIPKTAAHMDAAKKYVAFAIANNVLSIGAPLALAARNSAYQSYVGKPGYENFDALLKTLAAPATRGRPMVAKWQEIVDQAVTPMLQQALSCKEDLPALLQKAKATIEGIK